MPIRLDTSLFAERLGKRFTQRSGWRSLWAADRKIVLENVGLRVDPGSIIGLLGENGAGKTTLLRILGGLLAADSGTLLQGSRLLQKSQEIRQIARYVSSDARSFYWRMTVEENLAFFGRLEGHRGRGGREFVDQVCLRTGLEDLKDRRFGVLSSGQMRRVALARAMLAGVPILLLDEPGKDLDDAGLTILHRMVQEHSGNGGAVLLATHDVRLRDWCDWTLVLRNGRVVEAPK